MPPKKRLIAAFRKANHDIHTYVAESDHFTKMATTMVAAVVVQNNLIVANVGDSRAYLLRGGKIKQISRDHSVVAEMVRDGMMTEGEARTSKAKNRLSRSIGGELEVSVDVYPPIPLQKGDKILLCSDGLTRYAQPEDLLRMSASVSLADATKRMIRFANKSGGADNVTAVMLEIVTLSKTRKKTPSRREKRPTLPEWQSVDTQYPMNGKAVSKRKSTIHKKVLIKEKYKIICQLGRGGMAQVWLAEEITFGNRQVAIKAPLSGLTDEEANILQARFQREVKVCAELTKAETPNIVKALTAEPFEDRFLLIMEYMPGGDLAQRIEKHSDGLPLEDVLGISIDILTALGAVHNHPLAITHRDIKPSNILFNNKGEACLGDFGLTQMGKTSGVLSQVAGGQSLLFSPAYRAPELSNPGEFTTSAVDIFSFGCVLWEMLTSKLYKSHKPNTPPSQLRSNVPDWLDELVVRCLLEDPWDRWQNIKEIISVLIKNRKSYSEENSIKYPIKNESNIHVSTNNNNLSDGFSLNSAISKEAIYITQLFKKLDITLIRTPLSSWDKWDTSWVGELYPSIEMENWGEVQIIKNKIEVDPSSIFGIRIPKFSNRDIEKIVFYIKDELRSMIFGLDISGEKSRAYSNYSTLSSYADFGCANDESLEIIAELENLTHINLDLCKDITDSGLEKIIKLQKLEYLNLHKCCKISDDGIFHVSRLRDIRYLNLYKCSNITDIGLSHLKNSENIFCLNLGSCDQITNRGLEIISRLKKIEYLNLSSMNLISDRGIEKIGKLPKLKYLSLYSCDDISDYSLEILSNMKTIEDLDLVYCTNITDAGLRFLGNLKKLKHLQLDHCENITKSGLEFLLVHLSNLERLDIHFIINIPRKECSAPLKLDRWDN